MIFGELKVGGLSNQRAKQADPRLAWYMFHAISTTTDTTTDNDSLFQKTSKVFNQEQTKSGTAMKLVSIPMGTGQRLFIRTNGVVLIESGRRWRESMLPFG